MLLAEAAAASFAMGAVFGAVAGTHIITPSAVEPPPPPPPPPPPIRKPKVKIFYKMTTIPLGADGEDTRHRSDKNTEPPDILLPRPPPPLIEKNTRVTTEALGTVALRRAPPPLSLEQKKALFFRPQLPLHIELIQRAQAIHH